MTNEKKPRTIDVEFEFDAPAEAVWRALTEADELTNWFPPEARIKPGKGGSVWVSWGPGMEWETPIDVWEPNKHLRLIYAEPAKADPDSPMPFEVPFRVAVDYHLETRGGGTVLRLVHSGFGEGPMWDNQYDGTVRGWQFELRGLKHYLEHHRGTNRVVVHARHPIPGLTLEEGWARLLGPSGLAADGTIDGVTPGDRYRLATPAGDVLEGRVEINNPPKDFCGTVENLNNGLLRLRADEAGLCAPTSEVNVWISTYGLPETETDALRERLQATLDGVFADVAVTT